MYKNRNKTFVNIKTIIQAQCAKTCGYCGDSPVTTRAPTTPTIRQGKFPFVFLKLTLEIYFETSY